MNSTFVMRTTVKGHSPKNPTPISARTLHALQVGWSSTTLLRRTVSYEYK